MLWVSLILFAIALLFMGDSKQKKIDHYFDLQSHDSETLKAINVKSLSGNKQGQRLKQAMLPIMAILGPRFALYIVLYILASVAAAFYILANLLSSDNYWLVIPISIVIVAFGYRLVTNRRRSQFEQTFPDALNIMMSAVTAGDSLMQAICYVGDTMDNAIGKEFKLMGDRLRLGETPEVVLQRSCKHYPYPEFIFFTVTLRANISRGGQLKGVLARLIRVLVESRTLEKKKMAMTSEARMSAKIVALIPVAFMFILNMINPQSIDFIVNDPEGRIVLYYVLGSEALGLSIIWWLVRGVRI
ncbi:type II secretion system F family protein [Vibrio hippocampi]|uniref:Type II secretion system protein GspF domain-containing protein n=1 Tax=Vibrio hippocampi TaxID=654686 RepID=A0ABM8ZMC8_9VIBR|nr:type II secretion system F family protein [Vibrio hippocampi]CAH0529687.1 hypothetical protein VHP8226_03442 [Vibrio hippocampi]